MDEKKGFKQFLQRIAPSLIAVLIGLVGGALFMLFAGLFNPNVGGKNVGEGIRLVLFGIFSKGRDAAGELTFGFNGVFLGNLLFRAMPLLMCGLSVALAMKVGLFNIGAPGQYLIGAMTSLILALGIPSETVSPFFIWIIAFVGGMLAAAVWGAIPGMFKALLNINEVISCIMTNWIAANLVTAVFEKSPFVNTIENSKAGLIYKTSANGVATAKLGLDVLFEGSQINAGIFIAIAFAVLVYIMMEKTTFGYQLKACGANRYAAQYAGIRDKRNIVLTMAMAGALAGGGAALFYLSGNTEFAWQTYQTLPAVGFNGIPAALIANSNPLGTIVSSLFLSALDINGQQLANLTPFNEHIASLIVAIIVYLSAFARFIGEKLKERRNKKKEEA